MPRVQLRRFDNRHESRAGAIVEATDSNEVIMPLKKRSSG